MNGPIEPERLTPEEEARLQSEGIRTVKAENAEPVPAYEVKRAKVRGFVLGAALAAGAAVAAGVGFLFIRGVRTPPNRRKHG